MRILLLMRRLLVCFACFPLLAVAQVSLSLNNLSVAAGDSGTLQATINSDASAVALQFDVLYDPALITVDSVASGVALTASHSLSASSIAAGRHRVVVTSAPVAALNSGALAAINFSVSSAAPAGATPVTWDAVVIADAAAMSISPASLTPGSINIAPVFVGSEPEAIPTLPLIVLLLLIMLITVSVGVVRADPSIVRSICAAVLLLATVPIQAQTLPGDANGDGRIDMEDVRLIVELILELGAVSGNADCNRDSTVNILDTVCSQIPYVPGETTPIILGPGDRRISAGQNFQMNLFAADPDPGSSLSWELVSGPSGLSVEAGGLLSWSPAVGDIGAHVVSVKVTDDTGRNVSASFTITVFAVLPSPPLNAPPQLSVPDEQRILVGAELMAAASASDPDAGDLLEFSLVDAPTGMTIDSGTGEIAWTPGLEAVGAASVVIEVTDGEGASDFGTFTVVAEALNERPIARGDTGEVRPGDSLDVPAPGVLNNDSDPNGDALSARLTELPLLGTVTLAADGAYAYTPTVTAPEIGLRQQCSYFDRGGMGQGVAVADIDRDGDVELVTVVRPTTGPELLIIDGATCAVDVFPLGGGEDIGEADPEALVTLANLDADKDLEIVVPYSRWNPNLPGTEGGASVAYLMAVNRDGTPVWSSPTRLSEGVSYERDGSTQTRTVGPVPVDFDGDGYAELLQAWYADSGGRNSTLAVVVAYDGASGDILWEYLGPPEQSGGSGIPARNPIVADLDLDGSPEIIRTHSVINADGSLKFLLPIADHPNGYKTHFVSAVANFDDDPYAEIVGYDQYYHYMFEHTGELKWRIDRASGSPRAYSNVVVAQLNDDPLPEYVVQRPSGVGAGWALYAYDAEGNELWNQADAGLTIENNALGVIAPAAFDFDRDRIDELVVQHHGGEGGSPPGRGILILSGEDGSLIARDPTDLRPGNGAEPLTIADVDGDGAAEIIGVNVFPSGGGEELRIFEGLEGHPFPAARAIRNQSNYQPTLVNGDGTIPAYPQPHWLIPGLNKFFATPLIPGEQGVNTDSFTYVANDGDLDSEPALVTIELTPFTAPEIVSMPLLNTSPGFAYEYGVLAIDPDLGDSLAWTLVDGPAGMTLSELGVLRWTPDSAGLGVHRVQVVVQDSTGNSDTQVFDLQVSAPAEVPAVLGMSRADAENTLGVANFVLGAISQRHDVVVAAGRVLQQTPPAGALAQTGSAVAVTLSLGPGPEDRDADSDGFSINGGDCDDGNGTIFPGAADTNGDGVDQDCDGIDGDKRLVRIELNPAQRTVLSGEVLNLTATGIFEDETAITLDVAGSWSRGPRFQANTPGVYRPEVSFAGVMGSAEITVVARSADELPPVAQITSPSNGVVVAAPVEVMGSVSDTNLLRWELAYSLGEEDNFVTFAEGTRSVVGDVLGRFDPTGLVNGIYTLRLRVLDTGGNVSEAQTVLIVESNLKIGHFTLQYLDFDLPLAGIPLNLVRNYDTRDKRTGDFGVGWRLGVNSIELHVNRELGSGWEVLRQGLSYRLVESDLHIAALRLPDGKIEAFSMVVGPAVSALIPFPPLSQSVRFEPLAGTLGTLELLEDSSVSILDPQPGTVTLRRDGDGGIFNPTRFRYTARDGTQVELDTITGVQRIETPGGQFLSITPTSISHSSGSELSILRDASGRVIRITDPGGFEQSYEYDANGDLRVHRDQDGFETLYSYDKEHNLLGITDPLNRTVARHEYDDDGRLIRIHDSHGNVTAFVHDLAGRRETVTDGEGYSTVYDYDDNGNVLRITGPLGDVTTNSFDASGNLLSTTNAIGEITRYAYDDRDNLTSQINAIGAITRFSYDANDRLVSRRDPLGRETRYSYTDNGQLSMVIDPMGLKKELHRDGAGNLVAEEDSAGRLTQFEYDTRGFQTGVIDARGNRLTRSFNDNGKVLSRTDARGNTDAFARDGRGLITRVTAPSGAAMNFGFNGVGELLSMQDELGNAVEIVEDASGNVLSVTDPNGASVRHFYDRRNLRIRSVDQAGHETRYNYDAAGRIVQTVLPSGGAVNKRYDLAGRMLESTDPNGNSTRYEYDAADRNIAVIDALGNRTEYSYDLANNLISRLDARGNRTDYLYDQLNRLTEVRHPDGTREITGYDAVGNVVSETDRLGREKYYTYDGNNNLLSVTLPDGATTEFTYDSNDNLIRQVDANGHSTHMEFDANDRLVTKRYPDGSLEQFSYNAAGQIDRIVLPDGKFIDTTYNGSGKPVSRNLNGDASEIFNYDLLGRLDSAQNLWGVVEYAYDEDGRIEEIRSEGGNYVRYQYDLAGNRTAVSTQLDGGSLRVTSYTYDALNRLSEVEAPDGKRTSYTYDEVGNVASIAYANGVISRFNYDGLNQLTYVEHHKNGSVLAGYDYTLDAAGRRVRVNHSNGDSVEYEYDAADRLLRESHRNAGGSVLFDQTFTYDAVGNRLTQQVSGQTETRLTYDTADKLLSAGAARFAYDANGRLRTKTASGAITNYEYDVEGQLVQVSNSTAALSYSYDAQGKRRQLREGLMEQNYLLDEASLTGYDQTLVAFDSGANPQFEMYWGDQLLTVEDGVNSRTYHRDGSQNVRLLTDESGAVSDSYTYDAFGQLREHTGLADNPYGFAGEWQSTQVSLVYLRARFYDPQTGRFLTRDPFGGYSTDPPSLHRYLYANANPIMYRDPSGEVTLKEMAIAGSINAAISAAADWYMGRDGKTIVINAITSGIFGAIGAGMVGNVAKGFAGAAANATRKGLVYAGIVVSKAAVNTLTGIAQLTTSDFLQGAKESSLSKGAIAQMFVINILAEAVTFGLYKPSAAEITKQAAKKNLARTGLRARLSGDGKTLDAVQKIFAQLQVGDDAVEILRRATSGLSRRNAPWIAVAEQQLELLGGQALQLLRVELTEGVNKLFSTPVAFDVFIDAAKKSMEEAWNAFRSDKP